MKRFKYLLFTFILMIISISLVKANEIYSIDVTLELDSNGNGKVTEVWDTLMDSKTELYKPMGDLGNSIITNYEVSMDGTLFTYTSWDIDASFSEKAYKNGINYTDDGFELCFGISSYGRHKYTLTYDVSNMIYNLNDAQMLYWKFINDSMNPAPKKITVNVSGPTKYSDKLDVWGYGYEGYAYVYDGSIYMSNIETRNFKSSEYAVLLVKYPLNTFDTTNTIEKYDTFDEVYESAEDGSFSYTEPSIWEIISSIVSVLVVIFTFVFFGFITYIFNKDNSYDHKSINMRDINNFRDIPCGKDILNAYFLAKAYGLYKKKEDLFGAAILKWVLDGTVTIKKEEIQNSILKTKTNISIDMTKDYEDDTPLGELYKILKKASNDGILESNELEKWCKYHYNTLYNWFDSVEKYVKNKYIEKGLIISEKKGNLIGYTVYKFSDTLEDEAIKLAGLKKYLKEISEIHKKEPIEVHLWQYYLMYAQIFGIAKEVAKQFKDLYPDVVSEMTSSGLDFTDILLINTFSHNVVYAASQAKTRAESYSSGGGGHSYGGGGGHSFGGGSGGGAR